MDNFTMDVVAESPQTLVELVKIAFRHNAPGGKATHWVEVVGDVPLLVLLWHEERTCTRLMAPLGPEKIMGTVTQWLEDAKYSPEPEHDGDNAKGFRLIVGDWGHVAGFTYSIVGISPAWAMYGK